MLTFLTIPGSGFTVKVVTSDNYVTRDSGLVLWDIEVGKGDCPKAGQQVSFNLLLVSGQTHWIWSLL